MFRLSYIKPEEAEGFVAQVYGSYPKTMGVPAPVTLLSVSPELLRQNQEYLSYFRGHKTLDFELLTAIRLIASSKLCYDYCVGFNSGLLTKAGMTEAQIESLLGDMSDIPFEENEKTLLRLIKKVVDDPKSVGDADVQACRDAGWSDSDILDASFHASRMAVTDRLVAAFGK